MSNYNEFCEFRWVDKEGPGEWYYCIHCQFSDVASRLTKIDRIHQLCTVPKQGPSKPPPKKRNLERPKLATRVKNFTLASISHFLKGAPTCTQEEIDIRASVCVNCHLFIPDTENSGSGVCGHHTCGCNLGDEKKFLNKLAWKDQSCPLGKW